MINYSQRVGNESEAHLCYVAQRLGWDLARPYAVDESYDFAIRLPGKKKFNKVQVKTMAPKRAGARASVDIRKAKNRRYKESEIDSIYAYNPATLKAYLIPYKKLRGVACEFSPDRVEWSKYEIQYLTKETDK